ncbi:RHS repeat-associated core domain-containing protein [Thermoflexibacter ruber]|uniref:RHS repeat-associated core domain-containing protein n=2 Tax=Thermoflexibacter ruber TaxID=1003 RepID=A0A1I2K297_9BACT|nr:RHS repeat-associated core domain-containing protein [Thermoflexibacter ruber]
MKGLDWTAPSPNTENKFTFNSKEKQTELGLHWHDYGARNYDAQIGRFFKVDRFAEKYYNFSPYQYAANNPIKYIDVNGDSIWISHNGQDYKYHKGQLYVFDRQTGQQKLFIAQRNSFLAGVLTTINQLGGNTAKGRELFDFFHSKNANGEDNYVRIEQQTNKNRGNEGGGAGQASDGVVSLKPSLTGSNIPTTNGIQMSPLWLDLGHELAHVQDFILNGNGSFRTTWVANPSDPSKPFLEAEKYATHVENIMRAQAGLPLRTHYAEQGGGGYEPTRIIDSNGKSLFYKNAANQPFDYKSLK